MALADREAVEAQLLEQDGVLHRLRQPPGRITGPARGVRAVGEQIQADNPHTAGLPAPAVAWSRLATSSRTIGMTCWPMSIASVSSSCRASR